MSILKMRPLELALAIEEELEEVRRFSRTSGCLAGKAAHVAECERAENRACDAKRLAMDMVHCLRLHATNG